METLQVKCTFIPGGPGGPCEKRRIWCYFSSVLHILHFILHNFI